MTFRADGEQEELGRKLKKVFKTVTTEPKFFGKKDKKKTIELRVDGESGSKRIVVEIDKKGNKTTQTYDGKIITRIDNVYTWWDRRLVRKAIRKFLKSRRYSSMKVSLIGNSKLVLADEDEKILDEEI